MSTPAYVEQKKRRARYVSEGLCIECRQPSDRVGKTRCTPCLLSNIQYRKTYMQNYRDRMRQAALDHYGSICACCGEQQKEFLCFDHINNDGAAQRREDIYATNLPSWFKKHGYPPGFQTLCHNCNHAKAVYTICPHRQEPGVVYPKALIRLGLPRTHQKR